MFIGLLSGCVTSTRWNPQSAVRDAERDIARSRVRFAFIGGFVPIAPGIPTTHSTLKVLSEYGRLEVGTQGCVQDESYGQRKEYARRYNLRMWHHLNDQNPF